MFEHFSRGRGGNSSGGEEHPREVTSDEFPKDNVEGQIERPAYSGELFSWCLFSEHKSHWSAKMTFQCSCDSKTISISTYGYRLRTAPLPHLRF